MCWKNGRELFFGRAVPSADWCLTAITFSFFRDRSFKLRRDKVSSMFYVDMETKLTSGKKRKMPMLRQDSDTNTVDDVSRGNANVNCSNIVVSFHEDQTSSIQYVASGSQALPTNANSLAASTNFHVSGTQAVFHGDRSPGSDQIQIFLSPQGFDAIAVNNLENNSGNKTLGYLDSFLVNKQQVFPRIPRLNGPDVQVAKEAASIDDEVVCLGPADINSDGPAQKKRASTRRPKKSKELNCAQQSEKDASLRSFDLIYQNSDKIKLPNSTWGYHKSDKDNNIIVFSKVRWFSTNACSLPLYERQVVLHESSEPKIYINNAFSPLEVTRPQDLGELEQILRRVDELWLCLGGPCLEFAESGALAQKDLAVGRWRHKCCPIVVARGEASCGYCASINQVFRYPRLTRLPFGRRARAHRQVTDH